MQWRRVIPALVLTVGISGLANAASEADQAPPTESCDSLSPIAIPCVATGKFADAVAAECRRVGVPEASCTIPLSHEVTQAARTEYLRSWVHRTARFQYALGDRLPFRDAQWIGTHNSFNSLSQSFSISHADSNQQLSLRQQLDLDVRSLELDLHFIPRAERLGASAVTVCHGQGPEAGHLGCTAEPLFSEVLPQVARWLNLPAHRREVLLLYLEDALEAPAAYASTVRTLSRVLRRPDGSSLVYRPDRRGRGDDECTPLPLDVSRDDVRAAGARVVLVGSCAAGWAGLVHDWGEVHLEGGSTADYRDFPVCDDTYGRDDYRQIVRYFEDSTLVSTLLDPTRAPRNPDALTPRRVAAMTECGVNLYGFDQLLPEDGRIQATLWSWAPEEPRRGAGACSLQGRDGRWVAAACATRHRAACLDGRRWTLTAGRVRFADAARGCAERGTRFSVPRTGYQNAQLHRLARRGGAWVRHRVTH